MNTQLKSNSFGHMHDQTGGFVTVGRFKSAIMRENHPTVLIGV